jgi:uncharacterized protein YbgA (DUF1722 family)/uncharacterized protein YbbK (DUF523 family)
MSEQPRPRLYASKCLNFCACWWNGMVINSEFIQKVEPFVDFVTHCPEVEIGLGVPRKWIRVVMQEGEKRLLQPSTGLDLTARMREYIDRVVPSLEGLDGFVLREGSPSCSMSRVRYYAGPAKGANIEGEGPGLFGEAVLKAYSGLPAESDGRLRDRRIREDFLTRVFALAALRSVEQSGNMRILVEYHSRNKYLFMTYSQQLLKALGQTVANREHLAFSEVCSQYRAGLLRLLAKGPRSSNTVNVLNKIYGYFSEGLSSGEKQRFHEQLKSFRSGSASLTSLREILIIWGLRFDEAYITAQTFFQPFPKELNEFCRAETF